MKTRASSWGVHSQPEPRYTPARMLAAHPTRDRQRGNSLLLALIVLSALATIGGLTVVSMQSSLKTATSDRAQSIALYAAESGAAAMMRVLRMDTSFDHDHGWSRFVKRRNEDITPVNTADLPSNGALPGDPNNPFSADQNAWYTVSIYNNRDDKNYDSGDATDQDFDGRVIIRSTGTGPQGSVAIVEWEVQRAPSPHPDPPDVDKQAPPPADPKDPPTLLKAWHAMGPGDQVIVLGWHIVSM
jgi:Tfp pilus assembly protein PilX